MKRQGWVLPHPVLKLYLGLKTVHRNLDSSSSALQIAGELTGGLEKNTTSILITLDIESYMRPSTR